MRLRAGALLVVFVVLALAAGAGGYLYARYRHPVAVPDAALTLEAADPQPADADVARSRDVLLRRLRLAGVDGARVDRRGGRRLVLHGRGVGTDTLRALDGPGRLRFRAVLAASDDDEAGIADYGPPGRPAVADRLGDAYTAAERLTTVEEGAELPKPVLAAFAALSAPDARALPLRMQVVVPAVTCRQLGPADDDPGRPAVACDGYGTKYLTDAAAVTSGDIAGCTTGRGPAGAALDLTFTADGQRRVADVTGALAHGNQRLAVVVDGAVLSAPQVQAQISGELEIGGAWTAFQAGLLCARMAGGELPLAFTEVL